MAHQNFFQQLFTKKDPVSRAINEAIDLLEEHEHDEAIAVLHKKALSREPENQRALLHLGIAHMMKGDLDEAEKYLSPIAAKTGQMNSDKATAQIALERVAKLRAEQKSGAGEREATK